MSRSVTAVSFVSSSDRRLKENITPITNVSAKLSEICGVYYNFKSKSPDGIAYPHARQIGVIAQDVEQVYPEIVTTQTSGFKAVDYPKLTAVLIEAVKEQQTAIKDLQARIEKLEGSGPKAVVSASK